MSSLDGINGKNIESPSGIPPAPAPAPARSVAHETGNNNTKKPKERAFGASLSFLSSMNFINGLKDQVAYRIRKPNRTPSQIGSVLLAWIFSMFTVTAKLFTDIKNGIIKATPGYTKKLLDEAKASVAEVPPQAGGGSSFFKKPAKYNELLYSTAYFPAILTLLIFLYFLLVLWWQYVLWVVGKINKYIGTNFKLPNIILKKKQHK